ncbi:MAG: hypothetical protein DMF61_09180 [Blastocatellia bacterium AA13]|nr:MAG: hypothetical protein DMF61_09180 [Blastocatellia bacterium AA13]
MYAAGPSRGLQSRRVDELEGRIESALTTGVRLLKEKLVNRKRLRVRIIPAHWLRVLKMDNELVVLLFCIFNIPFLSFAQIRR